MRHSTESLVDDLSTIWRLTRHTKPKPALVHDLKEATRLVQLHIAHAYRAAMNLTSFFVAITRLIISNDDRNKYIPHILAHYDDFLEELDAIESAAIIPSLLVLEQSLRKHLAYPPGVGFIVCKVLDPFLEKRGDSPWSSRSEAFAKALPRVPSARTNVLATAASAQQALRVARMFRQGLQLNVLSRIRFLPVEGREKVLTPVKRVTYASSNESDALKWEAGRMYASSGMPRPVLPPLHIHGISCEI